MEIKPNEKIIRVIPVTNLNFTLKVHWGYGTPVNTNFHSLKIVLVSVDGIKIADPDKFLKLSLNTVEDNDKIVEKQSSHLKDVIIPANYYPAPDISNPRNIKIPINVAVDENEILEFEKNQILIKYRIEVKDDIEAETISTEKVLQLDIISEDSDSNCDFIFNEKFIDGFKYENNSKVKLGDFIIYKEGNDATTNNPIIFDLKITSEIENFVFFDINGIATNNIQHIKDLKKQTIAVCADLIKIPNPANSKKYEFNVNYFYTKNKVVKEISKKWSFNILQDVSATKSIVKLIKGNQTIEILNDELTKIDNKISWIPNKRGSAVCFSIRIGSYATNSVKGFDNKILINDFSYFINFDSQKLKLKSEQAFVINPEPDEKMVFENNEDSYEDFSLIVNNLQIESVPFIQVPVECNINFNYTIQGIKKQFSHTFQFLFGRSLGNYRLSLDIGTSAIVSTISKGLTIYQLNLQNSLKKIINNDKIYNENNIEEYGTNFLSSTLALIPEGNIISEKYDENVLRISPTKDLSEQFPERILPYLKSLVGQITLPERNETNDIEYFNSKNLKVTLKQEPIKTKDLIINTYKSVVKNFVVPQIKALGVDEDLHRITLTIPNTYTLRHQSYIKKVFMDNFKDFPEEEIHFVSESDAVVAYYIANHKTLNEGRNIEQLNRVKAEKEHVMVYDIGAGTLDITYFTINKKKNNDKEYQEVDVIGRFGALTAGNYLDYIIARIVFEEYNSNFNFDVFQKSKSNNEFTIKMMYKNFIKKEIKPILYVENKVFARKSEFLSKDFEIDLNKIIEHKYYKDYLELCSSELFKNYFAMYSNDNSTYMPLDTVIMSGRTSNLKGLRIHVEDKLKEFSKNNELFSVKLEADILKSVVSDGAILKNYFDLPNSGVTFNIKDIYAQYGILFQSIINGTWNFIKLLDGKTYQEEKIKNPNRKRYSFKNVVDLSGSIECHIVQTYYADTAKEMNEGKDEYINKIFSFAVDEFYSDDSKNAEIQISIDNNKEMIIELIDRYLDEPTAPLTIKSESNLFKNSLWPYYEVE